MVNRNDACFKWNLVPLSKSKHTSVSQTSLNAMAMDNKEYFCVLNNNSSSVCLELGNTLFDMRSRIQTLRVSYFVTCFRKPNNLCEREQEFRKSNFSIRLNFFFSCNLLVLLWPRGEQGSSKKPAPITENGWCGSLHVAQGV